jgi:hypothetical protein
MDGVRLLDLIFHACLKTQATGLTPSNILSIHKWCISQDIAYSNIPLEQTPSYQMQNAESPGLRTAFPNRKVYPMSRLLFTSNVC